MGFVALCGAVAVARGLELLWSRANRLSLGRRRGVSVAREKIFPWMVLLHAGTLVAAPLEARAARRLHERLHKLPLAALGAATLLRIWALRSLGRAWSVHVLRYADERPVVTRGPYRFIRHPNYLAVIIELLALPLSGGAVCTAIAASLLNAALLARRIPFEEKLLFADERYRRHFAARPRFILWPWPRRT